MQVQVTTDNHIDGSADFIDEVRQDVESAFSRFMPQLTRVEVHLKDVNSHKQGDRDKHCLLEARLAGLKPIAASHEAPALPEAVSGAIDKLERSLDRTLGRLEDAKGRVPTGGEPLA